MMASHRYNREGDLMQDIGVIINTLVSYILSMTIILNTILMDTKFDIVSIVLLQELLLLEMLLVH